MVSRLENAVSVQVIPLSNEEVASETVGGRRRAAKSYGALPAVMPSPGLAADLSRS